MGRHNFFMEQTYLLLFILPLLVYLQPQQKVQGEQLFIGTGKGSDVPEFMNFPSSDSELPCDPDFPPYPHGEVEGTVGLLVNDSIVLCGGARYDDLGWYKDCFQLVSDEVTGRLNWKFFPSMSHERGWAQSILLKDGSWLVLMGEGRYGSQQSDSEIFNISTGTWTQGPEFPYATSGHCAVSINQSHILLVGGFNSGCFIFNLEDNSFEAVPDLPSSIRQFHSCARRADGIIAIAGGCIDEDCVFPLQMSTKVELFDPQSMTWTAGPELDVGLAGAALVADGEDLLLIGGLNDEGLKDTVYRLRNDEWELLDSKLKNKKSFFPTMTIDTSDYNC